MNTKTFALFGLLAALLVFAPLSASAQTVTLASTTLSALVVGGATPDNHVCLASATGVTVPGVGTLGTDLVVDTEVMIVRKTSVYGATCFDVTRSARPVGHASGATVYLAQGQQLQAYPPSGTCTLAGMAVRPWIVMETAYSYDAGLYDCVNNLWTMGGTGVFYVPPTQCTFVATTLTQTSTYTTAGNAFVLKGISNAAAGTMTLTCNILVPTAVTSLRGAQIIDVTAFVASSATGSGVVPTSVGTSTLGSITFPTAATSETASTGTPVAAGGTVTTTGGAAFLTAVTTDGTFYTLKNTYATVVSLGTDLQVLVFTQPILQSAASISTLFTPGLMVHYRAAN